MITPKMIGIVLQKSQLRNIAVIICTEPDFEKKSLLLVRSIRKWGGGFRNIPIYSLSPRNLRVSQSIRNEFKYHNVNHREINLNDKFIDYGLANKPLACSYFAKILDARILVFLDSDQIILNEPGLFNIHSNVDLAIRPVDLQNIGIKDFDDQESEYWRNLYQIAGSSPERKIKTTVCQTEIYEYYNSGMIVTQRENHLFNRWYDNFEKVIQNKCSPKQGIYFLEQSILSATITAEVRHLSLLGPDYNYPIHLHNELNKSIRKNSMEEIVSIHYHKIFDHQAWQKYLPGLRDFKTTGTRMEWIVKNLQDLKI